MNILYALWSPTRRMSCVSYSYTVQSASEISGARCVLNASNAIGWPSYSSAPPTKAHSASVAGYCTRVSWASLIHR